MIKQFEGIDEIYNISLKNIKGLDYGYEPGIKLIYLIKGQVVYRINDRELILNPGEVLVLNRFDSRFIYSRDLDNLILALDIKRDYMESYSPSLHNLRFINHIDKNLVNKRLTDTILDLYRFTRDNENEKKRQGLVNNILKNLMSNYLNREYDKKLRDDKLVNLEILSRDYDHISFDQLNLASLSQKLHLSES